ncbi:hypothetical protein QYE76_036135 [Lolium multiflorum]|uniref:Transposase (putative) gypsy type domain-containing protein n=1 Tax=Lolium multiflorum TaxID=4521 RepID=A0AAD8R282_LOLMU|nr:hypothetical protein QYE76_036135 [Lolium multiflorum]
MAAQDLGALEWERSKISNQDVNLMKKLDLTKKKDALRFPSEESYPSPPMEYRVSFVDHLIRGLSTPIHDFLRGLLFVYGLQLHQLTPNSILHVSIFITLCKCFLGVQPNWALWKRIFCLRRNGSHNIAYNIGGVVICVREGCPDSLEYNSAPFDGSAKIHRRRSSDVEATEEEKTATEALMTRIHELQNTRSKELSGIQLTAYFLRIRVQPLQARKNALWMYAGDEDMDRLSKDLSVKDLERLVRRISSLRKKDVVPTSCRVEPYSGANALPSRNTKSYLLFLPYLKAGKSKNGPSLPTTSRPLMQEFIRLGTQFVGYRDHANSLKEALTIANKRADDLTLELAKSEKARKTSQEFELEKPDDDRLLDALSLHEIYGDEVRQSISDAKAAFSRLFPYFFPKIDQPNTFAALTKYFIPKEDLGLALRQENLKIGVEGTIALVAESQQSVDWAKVGDVKKMETKRW